MANMLDLVQPITKQQAKVIINKWHYSKVMPRITKLCIGGYKNNNLVAACTLGYGVRPLHTLKKMFPSLEVADYLEIGKLCVSDDMPRNTESYFISRIIKLLKRQMPGVKLLFSWADGIIGKPGYVYQASNFYYGGYIWTEMYLDKNGVRIHPRTLQGISIGERVGTFKTRRFEVTQAMGMTKYFGVQFRYIYPLCHKREWQQLQTESPFSWRRNGFPKDIDCQWKRQVTKGVRVSCGKPNFVMTDYVKREAQTQPKLL